MKHPSTITVDRGTGKDTDEVASLVAALTYNAIEFDLVVKDDKYVFQIR